MLINDTKSFAPNLPHPSLGYGQMFFFVVLFCFAFIYLLQNFLLSQFRALYLHVLIQFYFAELAGQFDHFANGMHQFRRTVTVYTVCSSPVLIFASKCCTLLSECAILKNLKNWSFKSVHPIYGLTSPDGQF